MTRIAHSFSQVSLFAFAAVASGICYGLQRRLLLWRRRGWEVVGDRIWQHLGEFSSWMCAGCVAGAVAFSANIFADSSFYKLDVIGATDRQGFELKASSDRHFAVVHAFFSVQLLCIIFAMNMLLRRVSDHASHSYYNEARDQESGRMTDDGRFDWRDCVGQYKMYYLVRSLHVVVMVLCAMNVVARFVIVAFAAQSAGLQIEAAAACNAEGKDTRSPLSKKKWSDQVDTSKENVQKSIALAVVLEATILVLTSGVFLLFFPACLVMFRRIESRLHAIIQEMSLRSDVGTVFLPFEFSHAMADGAQIQEEMPVVEARTFLGRIKSAASMQRRRFMLCLILVQVALLIQSTDAVFVAFALINTSIAKANPACDDCESCQSVEHLMSSWYFRTPELFPLVVSTCSTLPLVFSLWLMMTKEDRELLLHPGRFRSDAIALQPVESQTEARLKAERVRMGVELL